MHYTIELNARDGTLDVEVFKVCSPRVLDDYERELLPMAAKARRSFGRLRMLVQSSRVGPLPGDTLARLGVLIERLLTRDDDRVAVVVDSSVSKAQLTALSARPQMGRFLSGNAARTWLLAHDTRNEEAA